MDKNVNQFSTLKNSALGKFNIAKQLNQQQNCIHKNKMGRKMQAKIKQSVVFNLFTVSIRA